MKQIIFIVLLLLSLESYSQRTGRRKASLEDFIGTWKLTKLADEQLDYRNDTVKKESLKFTKDSVFVIIENREYAGTWKLVHGQPIIDIIETNQFNYIFIAGSDDSKFFTTKGLGYYKYFVRISKY